ncbi:MAG TPA: MBL fold metallo-hydrolase, partial [Anaerolineae bacterium]|nr:MBL fold metallo-hydrolase [Anaerolineae bacterium]
MKQEMCKPIRIELPTPYSVGSVNSYLFVEPEPTLVDCGMQTAESIAALKAGLAQNGLVVADLKHVVVTHAHVDHMGLIGWLAERSEATFWINEYCLPWAVDLAGYWQARLTFMLGILLKIGFAEVEAQRMVGYFKAMLTMWGDVSAEKIHPFPASGTIPIGGQQWQVLYLPGHAAMQTGFYQPEQQWLLSADCLLPITPIPVIENDPVEPTRRSRGLQKHLESLAYLEQLEISCTFPGHGRPIANHRRLIAKQVARIQQRKEACFALLESGLQTLPALTDVLYSHHPKDARFTGMSMVLGYLDL